jgi:amino acid transporter
MQQVSCDQETDQTPKLKSVLRYRDVVLLYLVCIFGYRQIVQAAGLGPVALPLLALVFALFFLPQAISVAELSSRYPNEGGVYVWTKQAFGDFHAFVCSWMYWTNGFAFYPAALFFMASNAAYVAPGFAHLAENKLFITLFSLAVLAVCLWVNIVGWSAARVLHNVGAVLVMWLPVAVTVLVGAVLWFQFGSVTTFSMGDAIPSVGGVRDLLPVAVLVYVFTGFDVASLVSEEVRDARRTIPPAIFFAGLLMALSYVAILLSLLAALPPDLIKGLTGSTEAMRAGGERIGGRELGLALSSFIGFCLSVGGIGVISGWQAAGARLPFVIGLDRYLPESFSRLHPRYGTPHVSLIVASVATAFFIVLSGLGGKAEQVYKVFVSLEVISFFIPYLYIFAAMVVLQKEPVKGDVFKAPGGRAGAVLIGGLGFVITQAALILACVPGADVDNVAAFYLTVFGSLAVNLAVGVVIYFLGRRRMTVANT